MESTNPKSLRERLKEKQLWLGFAAEFIATGIFVFMVCGATLSWPSSSPTVLHIALTVGLTVAILASSTGHITGGQVNPAVTLGFILTRRLPLLNGVLIICGQFLGGILGAALLYGLTPSTVRKDFGVTLPAPNVHLGQAVGIEAFLTFVLIFTIQSVTDPKKPHNVSEYSVPVIIGFCVCVCHMVGIPFTGSSLNPARSFAPALINNLWTDHWVYWVGPTVGSIVAAFLYEKVFSVKKNAVTPDVTPTRTEDGL